jgi:tRNA-2-methylthio-N6-dimethylallyladenosine synthase
MMKFKIVTYGCQINEYESEKFRDDLLNLGLNEADSIDEADIVLFNSCAVRERSQEKLASEVGYVRSVEKRKSRKAHSIVTGCVATVEERRIKRIGKDSVLLVLKGSDTLEERRKEIVAKVSELIKNPPQVAMPYKRVGVASFVPLIYGCDNFCTYCIVPITKGRERSRPKDEIISEAESLVDSGAKEITLLGQNINHYGRDFGVENGFIDILESVDKVQGLERLRFLTAHPADFNKDIVRRLSNLQHIENHFHLPVQSGSNRILELMKRGYVREYYIELINEIRKYFKDASFTTDIIVGFPTETEEDFLLTESLVKEICFDKVFTAAYSIRPNTPASRMGQVDNAVKNERLNRLLAVENAISIEKNTSYIGLNVKVLVENIDSSNAFGRIPEDKLVIVEKDPAIKKGDIINVKIVSADAFHLRGIKEDGK